MACVMLALLRLVMFVGKKNGDTSPLWPNTLYIAWRDGLFTLIEAQCVV